jgi:hypothetical protein
VRDGTSADDDLGVVGCSRGNVSLSAYVHHGERRRTGQSPGGLELKDRVIAGQELDKSGNNATLDDSVNRRVLLLR